MTDRAAPQSPRPTPRGSGLTRSRRPRLSEQQTREAMLASALAAIRHSGLNLGLDDISMEDVIRDAGVSRTTAYRCWPNKDLFVADLIVELATQAIPVFDTRQREAAQLLREQVLPRLPGLADPESRWAFAADLMRQASWLDFEITRSERARWQTYFALLVMLPQLPEGELRDQLRSALGTAERRYRERLAANHRVIAEVLGFRLIDPAHGAERVVELIIALWRGLVLREVADDGAPLDHDPDAGARAGETSLPALGVIAILSNFYEVDPSIEWDTHIEGLRDRLTADDLFGS